jgi:hypothetical protein
MVVLYFPFRGIEFDVFLGAAISVFEVSVFDRVLIHLLSDAHIVGAVADNLVYFTVLPPRDGF